MTPRALRALGDTGLSVSPLGFGAMHFDAIDDEAEVGRLLNGVLDAGVTLVDTARGYGRGSSTNPVPTASMSTDGPVMCRRLTSTPEGPVSVFMADSAS